LRAPLRKLRERARAVARDHARFALARTLQCEPPSKRSCRGGSRAPHQEGLFMQRTIRSVTLACVAIAMLTACPTTHNELETEHGGRSLGQWMQSYWQWNLTGTGTARSGDVVFLPIPNGTDPDGDMTFTGSMDVSMSASDVFAMPLFVWVGETYGGTMPDDDPASPTRADFVATHLVLTLDGNTVLDSGHGSDLSPYYFDAQHFDATITYPMPTSYGATGAIWVKGLGILHVPLSRGTHVLHLVERNDAAGVGFDNTWNITVE
jgi:hypothetical protein